MNRRKLFAVVAGGATSLVVAQRAFATVTIPFPHELGLPSLPVPGPLEGTVNLFPVPSRCYIRAVAQSNCETKNVVREATIDQFDQSGALLQSITATYNGPNDTGITQDRIFAAVDSPTWLKYDYSVGSADFRIFKVKPLRGKIDSENFIVDFSASYASREGIFHIVYSSDRPSVSP
jgi:hypothetical protein